MLGYADIILKRGHVIFGFVMEDIEENIGDLGLLFFLNDIRPVFNTENCMRYILSIPALTRLGVGRKLELVRAHDRARALKHSPNQDLLPRQITFVHLIASEDAYRKAKRQRKVELELHKQGL